MSINITLASVGNLIDATTAQTTINNNFSTIQTALGNALSLNGQAPNQMAGNLDLNGNQLLNQGTTSYTVATLPASPTVGRIAVVTDGTSGLAWGATVTGGHTTSYLVWYNGSTWTILGK